MASVFLRPYAFVQLMEELGIECQVGDPAKIRAAEPRKQKHDRRDADLILKKQQAITNYRKSLELDPKNQNAADKLKELEQK